MRGAPVAGKARTPRSADGRDGVPAWNAGFSRHSGPQGRGRFVANPGGRTRSRAIPANEVVPPPAWGGLCRLKPAFRTVPAILVSMGVEMSHFL